MKRVYKRVSQKKYKEIYCFLENLNDALILPLTALYYEYELYSAHGVKLMYLKCVGDIDKYYVLKELL